MLTGPNLNIVQERMLVIVTMRKNKQKQDEALAQFEQDMLIVNPQMYHNYIKQKQEDINSGNANITWVAPESVEEAQELMGIFADIDKQIKNSDDDLAADEEFMRQAELLSMFNGINVDEIGGE